MESRSRTEYSARNSSVALISQLIHLFVGFALRIVFTHTLSEDYVGVNGLFLDIINILSLSELGVGTAITYALYRPIEEGDIEKQKSLMRVFRQFYHMVALIVLALGLILIPFMDVIIKDPPNVEHLTIIYLFYLASAVSSYLLVYKRTLIDAHQLAYIGTVYNTVSWVIQDGIQILVLLFTRNFILFLSINLITTVVTNVLISRKANQLYPFLKEQEIQPLSMDELSDIRKNVGAMFLHKMSSVVVNNTDNLLMSAFVGIVSVGKYSNYLLITKSLRNIVRNFFQGIMASVGNLGVSKNQKHLARVFHATLFINQWISCFASITLFEIFNLFVGISFGKKYVFEVPVVVMICLNFYLGTLREGILVFRDSLGVFWYDRYKAVAEAIINLIVSVILAQYMGTAGVLLGTVISTLTTSAWVEPYMLYKHRLGISWLEFWKRIACYIPVSSIAVIMTHFLCQWYHGNEILMILYRLAICVIVPNLWMLCVYCRNREFVFLLEKARGLWKQKMANKASVHGQTIAQRCFLDALRSTFCGKDVATIDLSDESLMAELSDLAYKQGLTTIWYDYLYRFHREDCSAKWMNHFHKQSNEIILANYRLWQQLLQLQRLFHEAKIPVIVLKGASLAAYYDTPELRKSGDLDLWVYQPNSPAVDGDIYYGPNYKAVEKILLDKGYVKSKEQHANHHVAFEKHGFGEVEVHVLWKEDFQFQAINQDVAKLSNQAYSRAKTIKLLDCENITVLSDEDQACHMLLHMLQHYVTHGFGWRLLCDWTVFWNHTDSEQVLSAFLEKAKTWKVLTFVSSITWICMTYLGLDEYTAQRLMTTEVSESLCNRLVEEIFSSGEFGEGEVGRMVAPESHGLIGLLHEFHHQMKRNHYEASKDVWRWPYLWVITLFGFIYNNHRLRRISTGKIIQSARSRARLRKEMKVFKEK